MCSTNSWVAISRPFHLLYPEFSLLDLMFYVILSHHLSSVRQRIVYTIWQCWCTRFSTIVPPPYLADVCYCACCCRSANVNVLDIPRVRRTFRDRSFAIVGSRTLNSLPPSVSDQSLSELCLPNIGSHICSASALVTLNRRP